MNFKDKVLLIGSIILVIIFALTVAISIIQSQGYHLLLEFKMDNNTLEAVKAINWSAIPQ